jgi:hypothetical protein
MGIAGQGMQNEDGIGPVFVEAAASFIGDGHRPDGGTTGQPQSKPAVGQT